LQYRDGDPFAVTAVEAGGVRTVLSVPLLKDEVPVGVIGVYRQEVRSFTDKQIALLQSFAAQAVIAMENARLITETREALDQQTATAEVLQVINSSPGDLTPVFDTMLEKATRLCDAAFGVLFTVDGEELRAAAMRNMPEGLVAPLKTIMRVHQLPVVASVVQSRRVLHIQDFAASDAYRNDVGISTAAVKAGGVRSVLYVPLVKDDRALGVFVIFRQEVRPFTDKQIALVQNFAAQAVIAMENARLINETREALEQQTATAEVLGVINASPGDLAPLFDAMLEKAHSLCGIAQGSLELYDGERFRAVAVRGLSDHFADMLQRGYPASDNPATRPLIDGNRFTHIRDLAETEYLITRSAAETEAVRTLLCVPLRRDDELLGMIASARREVRPFSDKEIALLENFAAQAVIAMENARLITETREALDQQTATAEILRVISGSATDIQPVFEAIVERAIKLCEAEFTAVARFDDGLLRLVATSNLSSEETAAFHSLFPRPPNRGFVMGRAFVESRPVNVEDVLSDPEYDHRTREILQSLTRYRSFLGVPIMREGKVIGVIGCARREVRAFTAAQIELVSTFADQAVIAIENARLLGELRDREAELRTTFDNMAHGVVMFDAELRLAAWNRNFQELLDLPDHVLAKRPTYADYLRILADRGEFGTSDIEAELSRRLEDTDQELRLERTRPDGRVIEVRRNAVPDGGFVLIYSDITERKRSEAEIRAARDAAEAAYRDLKAAQANLIQAEKMASLGQLTAGIAHEIKNPLNFVNNFAGLSVELLDELKETAAPAITALDDDTRAEIDEVVGMLTGNLEKIAEHGRRADNIVKSMLEHSRGSSGERRTVDLNGLIEEALNLAYHGARAQDQNFNITLERDFARGIAPIELVPQDITRVCLNLIGNGFYAATKRQKEGADPNFKPTLKVSTRDLGNAVEVRIRDNGTGIVPEIKDKLFQPFFTTKPTGEGTGLGLSISYDIVTQQHGGTITVDSRVGEYTEFTVRLPRRHRTILGEAAS
jgi:PAS domain S-box-containing protein